MLHSQGAALRGRAVPSVRRPDAASAVRPPPAGGRRAPHRRARAHAAQPLNPTTPWLPPRPVAGGRRAPFPLTPPLLRPQCAAGRPGRAAPSSSPRCVAVAAPPLEDEAAAAFAPAPPAAQQIRIKLKSYEHKHLREAGEKIVACARATGATAAGPTPLPTRRRMYCVLRSPHVNKNSMEHFQLLTHQRLIDIKLPTAQTIDALMQLDLPAGVNIEVKL